MLSEAQKQMNKEQLQSVVATQHDLMEGLKDKIQQLEWKLELAKDDLTTVKDFAGLIYRLNKTNQDDND